MQRPRNRLNNPSLTLVIVRHSASLLLALLLSSACSPSPGSGSALPSPTPPLSPTQTASPVAPAGNQSGAFGVLITPPENATYTITLVGTDGGIAATARAAGFLASPTCAGIAKPVLPLPVSTSNTRVYFMDNAGLVHFLDTRGEAGSVATLPHGPGVRSMFAVRPDDKAMAVVVSTFSATTEHATLYLYDLVARTSVKVFDQTATSGLWPIGWHGGSLVVGKTRACSTGSALGCCGPTELHVVDPITAVRRLTIGGGTCMVAGPSVPAGTPCLEPCDCGDSISLRNWSDVQFGTAEMEGGPPLFISPDGRTVLARWPNTGRALLLEGGGPTPTMGICGWIDNDTILGPSGDVSTQAQVGNMVSGKVKPVAALGTCAGRIPGGL